MLKASLVFNTEWQLWPVLGSSVVPQATEETIWELFSPIGSILELYILRNNNGKSRGCAFVTYQTKAMAEKAITALNGCHMSSGKILVVKLADRSAVNKSTPPAPQAANLLDIYNVSWQNHIHFSRNTLGRGPWFFFKLFFKVLGTIYGTIYINFCAALQWRHQWWANHLLVPSSMSSLQTEKVVPHEPCKRQKSQEGTQFFFTGFLPEHGLIEALWWRFKWLPDFCCVPALNRCSQSIENVVTKCWISFMALSASLLGALSGFFNL